MQVQIYMLNMLEKMLGKNYDRLKKRAPRLKKRAPWHLVQVSTNRTMHASALYAYNRHVYSYWYISCHFSLTCTYACVFIISYLARRPACICTEIPSCIHWTVPHARIHDGSAAHMHPPLRNTRPASRSSSYILVDMAGRCDLGRVLADGSSQLVVCSVHGHGPH